MPMASRGYSFRIEAGEVVAVVGASGCGKTTLVKLLLGLLKPSEGGRLDLHKAGPANIRKIVGAVIQNDQLFGGGVAENISIFDPQPDQALVSQRIHAYTGKPANNSTAPQPSASAPAPDKAYRLYASANKATTRPPLLPPLRSQAALLAA
jgi:ABC-type nitrate/sulfonate/bicarbonate transport system ATPase subunit